MALNDKSNGVFESVLFKPETTGSETVFKNGENADYSHSDSQVGEEVLFGGGSGFTAGEELEYSEPQRDDDRTEVLFDTVKNVREEYIEPVMPVRGDESVGAEAVFTSGVEDLDDIHEAKLEEEDFDFIEPVKPNTVGEEVLFTGAGESAAEEAGGDVDFGAVSSEELLGDLSAYAAKPEKSYIDKTFAYKMLEADDALVGFYKEIRSEILKYKHVKARYSNNYESFNSGRTQLFKIGLAGKTVKLYLNLPISETEGKMHCKDMSAVKSYAEVPTLLKVRSARAVGYAKTLILKAAELHSLKLNKKPAITDNVIELLEQYNEKHVSK